MNPVDVVKQQWDLLQARDWSGLREILADDLLVEYPLTDEHFAGRDNYLAINRDFPEGWSIEVLRIHGDGDQVVSEVEVPQEAQGIFRVLALSTVRDDVLIHSREYWVELGVEQAPPWRARYRLH